MHDSQSRVFSAETAASDSAAGRQMSASKGDEKVTLITSGKEELVRSWAPYLGQHTRAAEAARCPSGAAIISEAVGAFWADLLFLITTPFKKKLFIGCRGWHMCDSAPQNLSCKFFIKNRNSKAKLFLLFTDLMQNMSQANIHPSLLNKLLKLTFKSKYVSSQKEINELGVELILWIQQEGVTPSPSACCCPHGRTCPW